MLPTRSVFLFLLISTTPLDAEVYKCDDEGETRYSTTPCNHQIINLELEDETFDYEVSQDEVFIVPSYPSWLAGWEKTKDLQLERFFEVEYEPILVTKENKLTTVNQQKLTNLPQSMSVQRFAISVEDIIESICVKAIIYPVKSSIQLSDKVFYGHYACSFRRDTKLGEIGHYKIMRGKNSIYMIAIKWGVEPFIIESGQALIVIETEENKRKRAQAESYLNNDVKLCQAGNCL